jgi:UDP-GlcNAc:undecaprenyl-phosphate GlcNAc-1-phosphate transferase
MTLLLLTFLSSFALVLILVPRLSEYARKVGLIDKPDADRKLHESAIPMVGGIALALAMIVICPVAIAVGLYGKGIFSGVDNWIAEIFSLDANHFTFGHFRPVDFQEFLGLLIGSLVLLTVGILDDRFNIRGRQKLLGQFVAATILILFGYHFESITIAGHHFSFGVFSIFFIYFWVLAAVNSVNLLDGADGIATTIGILMSATLCVMMVTQGLALDAVIAISITGALLGFLCFNFPPAKAYLGDAGSMLIGFLLSALAIRSTFKQNSLYAFLAPMALLAIPFIDTAAAIVRRRLTGRSIFAVDRGHLHHTLMKQGYSPRGSLLWVTLLCATTAAGGALALINHQSEYAVAAIAIVGVVMFACRLFGIAEFKLVTKKAYSVGQSLLTRPGAGETNQLHETSVHVQGNRNWQDSWQKMCDFANDHSLQQMTMDLNAPWLHESFHAKLKSSVQIREANHIWHSTVPLVVDNKVFGRIEFSCSKDCQFSHHYVISEILKLTKEIELSLEEAKPTTVPENNGTTLDPGKPSDTVST